VNGKHDIQREHIGDARPIRRSSLVALMLMAGAPLAFLTAQVLRYALTGPACEIGAVRLALELATLVGVAGAAAVAWYGWRVTGTRVDADAIGRDAQPRFMGNLALMLGALFLLAGAALWLPSLFLSPCGRP
jgi:predicted transporter